MHLTKSSEQKITTTSSKKVVQNQKSKIKKNKVAYLQRTRAGNRHFVSPNPKIESVQIDWDET